MGRFEIVIAAAVLAAVATWNTEAFHAWAFPDEYRDTRLKSLRDSIAAERAIIADIRDELAAMPSDPVDAAVYVTLRRSREADIEAAESVIADMQRDLAQGCR